RREAPPPGAARTPATSGTAVGVAVVRHGLRRHRAHGGGELAGHHTESFRAKMPNSRKIFPNGTQVAETARIKRQSPASRRGPPQYSKAIANELEMASLENDSTPNSAIPSHGARPPRRLLANAVRMLA